jgi:hypothetical protein
LPPSIPIHEYRRNEDGTRLCDYVDFLGITCQNTAQKGGRCCGHGSFFQVYQYGAYNDPIPDYEKFLDLHSILSKGGFGFVKRLRGLRDKVGNHRLGHTTYGHQSQTLQELNFDLAREICGLAEEQVKLFFDENDNEKHFGKKKLLHHENGKRKWRLLRHDLLSFMVSVNKNAVIDVYTAFDYGPLSLDLRTAIRGFVDENVYHWVRMSSDGSCPVFKLGTTGCEYRWTSDYTYPNDIFLRPSIRYFIKKLPPEIRHLVERYAAVYGTYKYGRCSNDSLPENEIPTTKRSQSECRLYIIRSRFYSLTMHESKLLIYNLGEKREQDDATDDMTSVNEGGGESHGNQDVEAEDSNLTSADDLEPASQPGAHTFTWSQPTFGGEELNGSGGKKRTGAGKKGGSPPATTAAESKGSGGKKGPNPSFPRKLFDMLTKEDETVVCWLPKGDAFVVRDKDRFVSDVLPRYFRQTKVSLVGYYISFFYFFSLVV